jgi:hypothetical protein
MPTVQERLDNIESGLVALSNRMAQLATRSDIDVVQDEIRKKIIYMFSELRTLRTTAQNAKYISDQG